MSSGSPSSRGGAGYSGTPLPKKLGIRPGSRVLVDAAPHGFRTTLGELPEGARLCPKFPAPDGPDVLIWFVREAAALRRGFGGWTSKLAPEAALWVAWPKKTSALRTDITREDVREVGLATGWVDIKVCAIDEDWSGLRFAMRAADRRRKA